MRFASLLSNFVAFSEYINFNFYLTITEFLSELLRLLVDGILKELGRPWRPWRLLGEAVEAEGGAVAVRKK